LFCFGEALNEVNAYAKFLVMGKANFLWGTWKFWYIIGDSHLPNRKLLKRGLKTSF
jgi:hypothetical protein